MLNLFYVQGGLKVNGNHILMVWKLASFFFFFPQDLCHPLQSHGLKIRFFFSFSFSDFENHGLKLSFLFIFIFQICAIMKLVGISERYPSLSFDKHHYHCECNMFVKVLVFIDSFECNMFVEALVFIDTLWM